MEQESQAYEMPKRTSFPSGAKLVIGLTWLWLLLLVPSLTDAYYSFFVFFFIFGGAFTLGIAWIVVSIHRPVLFRSMKNCAWWFSAPLAGVLMLILYAGDWDLQLRVSLCEDELNEYAVSVQPGTDDRTWRCVGLFSVNRTFMDDKGVVYLYTSTGFLDDYGIAYVPPGCDPPKRRQPMHLHGRWYWFREKF
jgi:hypothetical protein